MRKSPKGAWTRPKIPAHPARVCHSGSALKNRPANLAVHRLPDVGYPVFPMKTGKDSSKACQIGSGWIGEFMYRQEAGQQALKVSVKPPPPSGGRLGGWRESQSQPMQGSPSPQPPPAGRGSERLPLKQDLMLVFRFKHGLFDYFVYFVNVLYWTPNHGTIASREE